MSEHVEGAITSDEEPSDPPATRAAERPLRPDMVEVGAAILIVAGITATFGLVIAQVANVSVSGLIPAVGLVMQVVAIGVGILVHRGIHWRVCINVVVIEVLVYTSAFPNPIALFYVLLYAIVVYALLRYRAWFDWKPPPGTLRS
jgi:hypothetical protein